MRAALIILCAILLGTQTAWTEQSRKDMHNIKTTSRPFKSGEKLTYTVSWSRLVKAGVATLEVKSGKTKNGRRIYTVTSVARSAGFVSTFYKIRDTVQSIIDAEELYSLSYSIDSRHGKRKKKRQMIFDQESHRVKFIRDGREDTYEIPLRVQDALSSLYYARTRDDLAAGKNIFVDVHEKKKTWSVEVQYIGKDTIITPAGSFKTYKVKTYPRYEGVFRHKGEITIWITDDARRIPVQMKSTITIGSIVATLTDMETGDKEYDRKKGSQPDFGIY